MSSKARLPGLLAPLLLVATTVAAAQNDIEGPASVVDGDTIDIGDRRIRLWGVDAPERDQICDRNGEAWQCGRAAEFALERLVSSSTLRCKQADADRHARIVAVCYLDKLEINRWLVREGWALDYGRYSKGAYAAEEAVARHDRRGIWSSKFALPWKWRRR